MNKIVEKAAVDAAARTAHGDVSPQVQMQEGQQQFAATPGVAAEKGKEPVTTEAAIVAPAASGRVGDRLVDPGAERPKKVKQVSQFVKTLSCLNASTFVYPAVSCGS